MTRYWNLAFFFMLPRVLTRMSEPSGVANMPPLTTFLALRKAFYFYQNGISTPVYRVAFYTNLKTRGVGGGVHPCCTMDTVALSFTVTQDLFIERHPTTIRTIDVPSVQTAGTGVVVNGS